MVKRKFELRCSFKMPFHKDGCPGDLTRGPIKYGSVLMFPGSLLSRCKETRTYIEIQ